MSFLGSLRKWLLFNKKIIPQKYNLPNNSALPVYYRQTCFFLKHLCKECGSHFTNYSITLSTETQHFPCAFQNKSPKAFLCPETFSTLVKLQNNRGNNKYSYTSNSDDNLLKNIELFDKLVLRFNGRVLFVKDVLGDEICCWSFYGEGRKIAEVCCTSIVYATEKKQTKVEFPEARIFEETLNILIYENNRGSGPGGLHLLDSRGSGSSLGTGQSEEEGAVGGDRRVRRIHVRRHIMHDERGHGQQTVYKD
uniref:Potassium channel tetramerization domain containing 13 n=1 Tax=Oreochromis niloticus TaxID=8128 RepID=A0A669EKU1_ORENI